MFREVYIIKLLEDDNMPYIICKNDNYLRQTTEGFIVVNEKEQASRWKNSQKANNVCRNTNLNKKFKNYHMCVEFVEEGKEDIPAIPIELGYDILDKVKEIFEFTKQIEQRRLYLIQMIHNIDLEIVDIEHAAEFYVLNASQGYKLYKLLHEARNKRRKYKDELQKINLALGTSMESNRMENLERSILGLYNRKYTPRINKELFGV